MSDLRTVAAKRLDAFVDGAFAFAVTMLVVGTAGAMDSYDGLMATFAHVPAFALSLTIIVSFWWAHRQFSLIVLRSDKINDALSMLIMFVILIYVFPVSFLMKALMHWLSDAALPGNGLLPFQVRSIYLSFGAGFAILSAAYALMYFRATNVHGKLRVPKMFRPTARRASFWWAACAITALLSMLITYYGDVEGLIWIPLIPYFAFLLLLLMWRVFAPIKARRAMNMDEMDGTEFDGGAPDEEAA